MRIRGNQPGADNTHGLRPARGRWYSQVPAALAGLALLLSQPGLAQSDDLESRVKAAFLFNFTKFVDWPPESFASASAPLEICVLAGDPLAGALDETVHGKSVNNRPLSVRRLQPGAEARDCKLLYLGDSGQARDLLPALRGRAVLTVGDAPEFIRAGGMIRFLLVDGKVRFEVNRGAAEQARLTLSSRLLSVAHAVTDGPGG
jgi:hypothetical protein